ncbi:hypothetical protein GCM10009716_36560 [Streptomyces sodiiphilus]|uniref:VanZ family protein n=1 Tax=Streptomyces sodiiphilus TaxID=226217 RepID=A0ABN2PMF4_9ACTN
MAYAKRIALYLLLVLALYAIIAHPVRSGEFVQLVFEAVSGAAHSTGRFLAGLLP